MSSWTRFSDGTWGPIQHADGTYDIRYLLEVLPPEDIREGKRLEKLGFSLAEYLNWVYKLPTGPEPVD